MDVLLTSELEEFVEREVSAGRFLDASAVIREGLKLLEARRRFSFSTPAELQEKLREGIEALDRGEFGRLGEEELLREGRVRLREGRE